VLMSLLRHLRQFVSNADPAALEPGHPWAGASLAAAASLASAVLTQRSMQ
jgi:hypothetical protein